MSTDFDVKILYGHKELKPLVYKIEERIKKKWFGFIEVKEYYIGSEYCIFGPFETYEEAYVDGW